MTEEPGNKTPRFILASASPRRTDLLTRIGVPHEVIPADVDETSGLPEAPGAQVALLAERKARRIAALHPEALVLGADTLVYLEGTILGKPSGIEEACAMVERLAGTWHEVYTGISLAGPEGRPAESSFEVTRVRFRPLVRKQIRLYVSTEEPFDKAGAYGIQGYGATLVESVEGCYFNVMGLPLARLIKMLDSRGYDYPFGPLVMRKESWL